MKRVTPQNVTIESCQAGRNIQFDGVEFPWVVLEATVPQTNPDQQPVVVLTIPAEQVNIRHALYSLKEK